MADRSQPPVRIEPPIDGIATLVWNVAGQPMNVFDEAATLAFLDAVERLLADPAITGVVIASERPEFHVGADIKLLQTLFDAPAADVHRNVTRVTAALRAIETSGKTFVAAINGHALGGGLEMALACHARIVSDAPGLKLGLPEVKLGLIPGFGGTQRLARLIGGIEALRLIGEGRTLTAQKAFAAGLVQEILPATDLMRAARDWIAAHPAARQPWDAKGYRVPGGAVQSANGVQMFAGASGNLRKATFGNYPAPPAAADCIYHGLQLPFDQGQRRETRTFVGQVKGSVARAMAATLFQGLNAANALEGRPAGHPRRDFGRIGIVGAGLMGAGIAYAAARRGVRVVLVDRDHDTAARGVGYSERLCSKTVARGGMDAADAAALLARIQAADDVDALANCDAVIEAVFEDAALKADILARVEAVVRQDTLIASNTSTLPITGLAAALKRPERFLGLHFFSPVEKMPLLEVISGAETQPATLAAAFDLAKVLRKTPIAVNDGRAFFTTRVVSSYITEGMAMAMEGVRPALIENAGRAAGMPMGPLRLADMVALDLAIRISDQASADLGESYHEHPGLAAARRLAALGRVGEKSKAGFYDYDGQAASLWPGLGDTFPVASGQPAGDEVQRRLLFVQAAETLRCFEERVIERPGDADIASILGWGFPPFTGGVASWMRHQGAAALQVESRTLAARHGARFAIPDPTQFL